MDSILQDTVIGRLPVAELQAELDLYLQPVLRRLPEKRLRAVGELAVQGILGSQSPLVTQMARGTVREEETIWPAAKRFYLVRADFTIRACYNRLIEVYNDRLNRWEEELLDDLTASVPQHLKLRATFTHARNVRHVDIALGWMKIRLLDTKQVLWVLVAHDPDYDRDLVLHTNIPVRTAAEAAAVYTEWRYRLQIEHTYRLDQEDGLDVKDMRVQTLERMRRLFVPVLLAALFVYHIDHTWPQHMLLWLRRLGGKLGLRSDLDGPYVLLADISAVFVTASTLAFAAQHPSPKAGGTCG